MDYDFRSLTVQWWYKQLKDSPCTNPQVTQVLIASRRQVDFNQHTNDLIAACLWSNPMLAWEDLDRVVHIVTGV